MKIVVHVDGGARGNPGPAAIGVVVSGADGAVIDELAERIGVATNNVAEYRAVLAGSSGAAALGASEVELVNDSELVAASADRRLQGQAPGDEAAVRRRRSRALRAVRPLADPHRSAGPERPRRRARQRGAGRAALSRRDHPRRPLTYCA